jgi:hypothetical protein
MGKRVDFSARTVSDSYNLFYRNEYRLGDYT